MFKNLIVQHFKSIFSLYTLLLWQPLLPSVVTAKLLPPAQPTEATGFIRDTVVLTPSGHKPIQNIQIGELVACLDMEGQKLSFGHVTAIHRNWLSRSITAEIAGTYITGAPQQSFLCIEATNPDLNEAISWIPLEQLKVIDWITASLPEQNYFYMLSIQNLVQHDGPVEIFDLTVAHHHNFCVSERNLIAHNREPIYSGAGLAGKSFLQQVINGITTAIWTTMSKQAIAISRIAAGALGRGLSLAPNSLVFNEATTRQPGNNTSYNQNEFTPDKQLKKINLYNRKRNPQLQQDFSCYLDAPTYEKLGFEFKTTSPNQCEVRIWASFGNQTICSPWKSFFQGADDLELFRSPLSKSLNFSLQTSDFIIGNLNSMMINYTKQRCNQNILPHNMLINLQKFQAAGKYGIKSLGGHLADTCCSWAFEQIDSFRDVEQEHEIIARSTPGEASKQSYHLEYNIDHEGNGWLSGFYSQNSCLAFLASTQEIIAFDYNGEIFEKIKC